MIDMNAAEWPSLRPRRGGLSGAAVARPGRPAQGGHPREVILALYIKRGDDKLIPK